MPLLRYVLIIGSVLYASMLAIDTFVHRPAQPDRADIDRTTIRVKSSKQPQELVLIDTSLPTITPPISPAMGQAPQQTLYRDTFAFVPPIRQAEVARPLKRKRLARRPVRQQDAPAQVQVHANSNTPW
jgi:hypothetical protein